MKKTVRLCSYKREASLIMEDAEEEALVKRSRALTEMKLGVSEIFCKIKEEKKKGETKLTSVFLSVMGKDEKHIGRRGGTNGRKTTAGRQQQSARNIKRIRELQRTSGF